MPRPMPRPAELYLVITPGAKAADCLAVALEAATIASVLIRGGNGQGVTLGEAAPLVELAQRHNVAVYPITYSPQKIAWSVPSACGVSSRCAVGRSGMNMRVAYGTAT